MFYYLKGTVAEIGQNSLVLDVNGIGFYINTTLKTFSAVHTGDQAKLYISESIGETNFDLFGFADQQEKRFFELLTSVSGVGPKVASCIMLFAYGDFASFPIDVWVKRVMHDVYGFDENDTRGMKRFAEETFGDSGGIAQQYLFHYVRNIQNIT